MDASPDSQVELLDVLGEAVTSLASVPDPDTMLCIRMGARLQEAPRGRPRRNDHRCFHRGPSKQRERRLRRSRLDARCIRCSGDARRAHLGGAYATAREVDDDVARVLVDMRGSGLLRHDLPRTTCFVGSARIAVARLRLPRCAARTRFPLNPLARALYREVRRRQPRRFRARRARAHSTPSAVSSLAQFARGQLTNALRLGARQ